MVAPHFPSYFRLVSGKLVYKGNKKWNRQSTCLWYYCPWSKGHLFFINAAPKRHHHVIVTPPPIFEVKCVL